MKKVTSMIYQISLGFVQHISLLLVVLLFISNFFLTCYTLDMESQVVLKRMDNVFFNLFGLLITLGVMAFILRWINGNPIKRKKILLLIVLYWCVIFGIILILFSRTVPAADAMSVFSIAQNLANGNTGVIHPTDSYLSYYPQQIGLVGLYEIIIRVWKFLPFGASSFHVIKCFNVLLCCIIILFTYKSVHLYFNDDRVESCYLILAGSNIPLLFYTSFVYGEIPSFAFFSIGLWSLLKFVKRDDTITSSWKIGRYAALSVVAFTCSVICRKNSIILVIAAILAVIFTWLKEKRHSLLLLGFLYTVSCMTALPTIQKLYEHRANNVLKSGVPAISYVAMGMQEASRGNGWYNGFNFYTYCETGMDTEITTTLSKKAITQRLEYFKQNPKYAATFYKDKFLSQWSDGTYACRQATLATFGGRIPFFEKLYSGSYSKYMISYCNTYQNIVYLGAFVFCIMAIKKKTRFAIQGLPLYLALIGVIGGFLFHMVWEANSRYIFAYGLLLLPYCAWGCSHMIHSIIPKLISPSRQSSIIPESAPR